MEDRTCLCLYCIEQAAISLVELVGVRHRINLEWDLAGKHLRVSHSEQRPIGDSFTPNVR